MRTLTRLRNSDFIARCMATARREHLRGHNPSTRRIVAITVYGPAGGYYVSFSYAYQRVRRLVAHPHAGDPLSESPSQARMRHLAVDTREMMDRYGLTVAQALTHVLARGGARRFYFSVDYGIKLFSRHTLPSTFYQSAI